MKFKEYIEFKQSINERIEELENYYAMNYDQPFMKYIQNGKNRLRKLIMFEPDLLDKIDNGNDIKGIGFGLKNQSLKEIGITLGNYTYTKGHCDAYLDKKVSPLYIHSKSIQLNRNVYQSQNQQLLTQSHAQTQQQQDEKMHKSPLLLYKGNSSSIEKQHLYQNQQQQNNFKEKQQQCVISNKNPLHLCSANKKSNNNTISPMFMNNSPNNHQQFHQKYYNEKEQSASAQKNNERPKMKSSNLNMNKYCNNQGNSDYISMKKAIGFNPNVNANEKEKLRFNNNNNKAQEASLLFKKKFNQYNQEYNEFNTKKGWK